jgi:hypothetical protein
MTIISSQTPQEGIDKFLEAAIQEAKNGAVEGGVPIGFLRTRGLFTITRS